MRKFILLLLAVFGFCSLAMGQNQNWHEVEQVFGRKGTMIGDVLKLGFPRSDLKIRMSNVLLEPGLALGSWIAFQQMGTDVQIMGDLVLLDREVAPVISKLTSSDIDITALHNHLYGETPNVMYLHFSGQGQATKLAQEMMDVLKITGTPLNVSLSKKSSVNWERVESILGINGKAQGKILQVSVPRPELITENGMSIPPSMGTASALNFQIIGSQAATTGDFVLLSNEVNPIIKTLIEHGIQVTTVHNHMLFESPRLFMLHFWGVNTPEKLAQGIRSALDLIHRKK